MESSAVSLRSLRSLRFNFFWSAVMEELIEYIA